MFDTFAKLLSSVPTFLFPIFASYKALKTSDPALLTPWLMYWVVLSCALLAESWVGFILVWIPFYAWFRLFFLLYLILPQTQGAKVIYQEHVHPFLEKNEIAIDDFISSAHDRAKAAGVTYLKHGIEAIKQYVFNLPPKEPTPPPTPTTYSYTQSLIARFNLPSARPSFPTNPVPSATSTANDFYSLLQSAVSAATSSTSATATGKARNLSNSGILVPPSVAGEDRLSFISAQRERLAILLSALDKEASTLQELEEDGSERPPSSMSGLSRVRSEVDFEKIDAESGTEEMMSSSERTPKEMMSSSERTPKVGGGSWLPWSWGAKPENTPTSVDTVMSGTSAGVDQGKSSGIDA